MYFWDELTETKVLNCPSCSATFTIDKGANCSSNNCSDKRFENIHRWEFEKMIKHYLPDLPSREIKFEYSTKEPITKDEKIRWGWALDGHGVICISWYTLRSKKKFLHCCAHEMSHITDYENQFSPEERKVIKDYLQLEERYKLIFEKDKEEAEKIRIEINYRRQIYKELIEKWNKWNTMTQNERHKRIEWYQEYVRIFKNLLESRWQEYAYGNFAPLLHEYFFTEDKDEKYSYFW